MGYIIQPEWKVRNNRLRSVEVITVDSEKRCSEQPEISERSINPGSNPGATDFFDFFKSLSPIFDN